MATPNERLTLGPGDALLVTDVQVDFLPGGRLAVARGDEVVPVMNRWIAAATSRGLPVFATRDWHPPDHCSFRERGGPWPTHCVAGSPGAAFAPGLELPPGTGVVSKATRADRDAYSSFEGTDFDARLRAAGVRRLLVGGLTTDYCVLETIRDARRLGYEVLVLAEGIRAVNVQPGDGERAEEEMRRLGARPVALADLTP